MVPEHVTQLQMACRRRGLRQLRSLHLPPATEVHDLRNVHKSEQEKRKDRERRSYRRRKFEKFN